MQAKRFQKWFGYVKSHHRILSINPNVKRQSKKLKDQYDRNNFISLFLESPTSDRQGEKETPNDPVNET